MNSEERQLITGLFDRMRGQGAVDKDRDADMLISQSVRQNPDAAYLLVQSVLVQDHALGQADERIRDLEDRIAELESQAARPQQSSGGSFLGGLFGGGAPARPAPVATASRSSSGFGGGATAGGNGYDRQAPAGTPSPWGGQPAQAAQPAPAAGGGFMKQAMATAAGVAGGMLVANSISSMLGGGSAQAGQSKNSEFEDTNSNSGSDFASSSDNDPGYTDAAYDDGGSDWGGDDIEV